MISENEIKCFDLLESPLEGTNLIDASAGTGKTYTIAGLFLRLLLEKRFSVNEILVVTYTVAATEELRDRIRKKLRETLEAFGTGQSKDSFVAGLIGKTSNSKNAIQLLQEALRDFDESPIFTIHGFCQRMLHENAFESGSLFDTELIPDQKILEQEVISDFWRRHFYTAAPEFVSYAQNKKFDPGFFLKILQNRIAHPDLEIIPDCGPAELESLEAFRELFQRLKNDWEKIKPEVLEKLRHPGLNQGQYGDPDQLRDAMDGCLANERGILPLFKGFEKLTQSKLRKYTNKGRTAPEHPFFNLCEEFKKRAEALQKEMDQQILFLKRDIFRYMKEELPLRKQRQNVQFFDDLLIRLRSSLEKGGGDELARAIRAKYKAALIDEFQDTDPIQYAIFRSVFSNKESILFLIGDPKQAIYSFRGADLFAYMKAARQVRSRYTLTKNWRSEPGLIEAVNTIFSNRKNPFLYEEIPFEPATPEESKDQESLSINGKSEEPFQLWFLDARKVAESGKPVSKTLSWDRVPRAVASEISRLILLGQKGKARIGTRGLREADIAVLVRTNDDARFVQDQLTALKIHSVLHSTGNLFDTDEALEMERVLAGIAEPNQEQLLRVALTTNMTGVKGEELDLLMADEDGWESWISRFREYYDLWERVGFIRMFRHFMFREKVRTRLLSLPNGQRRLTNVLHLSEVLHQEATEQKLGMVGLLKWLARQRDKNSPRLEENQLRLESDANAVKIVTIHKSKGLEYPIVICPFNWWVRKPKEEEEFTFHDPNHDGRLSLVLNPKGNPNRPLAEEEILAENMRLLYVSLTRAKNRCYLLWGRFNDAETSSLAHLLHPIKEEPEEVVRATKEHFKELSDKEIRLDLETLTRKAKGKIQLSEMPMGSGKENLPPLEAEEELSCQTFSGVLERDRQFASFSYLLSGRPQGVKLLEHASVDLPDHDEGSLGAKKIPEEEPTGIFAFPKGTKAGIFFHDIFEHLDFEEKSDSSLKKLVSEKLRQYDFEMKWQEILCEMMRKVLTVPLLPKQNGLTLSSVSMKDRLSELEFYYPLESITPIKLKKIFAEHSGTEIPTDFPDQIEELNFQPARGLMRGFMDLVFHFQGRFYLVDWKSNLLGNRVGDYGPEALAAEMRQEFYILQYHIYVVALNQYLKIRISDYDYERHFGGVFYVFLRGVDPERGPEFGVFRDVPKKQLIDALCRNLITPSPLQLRGKRY